MRNYWIALLSIGLLLGVTATEADAQAFFTANLTTAQETGGATGDGSGTAAFVLTEDGLRFILSVDSLTGDIAAAHIHSGAAGQDGGPVRTLTGDLVGNSGTGVWTAADSEPFSAEMMEALWKGELYVNVHTADNPAGEIRGQIYPTSGVGFSVQLTPEQETGDVESDAAGTGSVLLSNGVVLYAVTVSGLSGPVAGAHFHQGAIGVSGGVVKTVTETFAGPTAIGLWTSNDAEPLTEELVSELLLGNLYLNVHTAANPGGEIRGQVLLTSGIPLGTVLDPMNEVPPVTAEARGTASVVLTEAGLAYDITVSNLTGAITGAHFHNARAGENGGVVKAIEFTDGHASGVWARSGDQPLTDELMYEVLAGRIYVNIHTAANPGGEIRGQLQYQSQTTAFVARLSGDQVTQDVTTGGVGTADVRLFRLLDAVVVTYFLTVDSLSGPITAAHFHYAPAGSNGGVVRTISLTEDFSGNTAEGSWAEANDEPLTDELIRALISGDLYINVHTANNPGGEIRGQVVPVGATSLTASLDAAQATADVTSAGSGTATLTLTTEGLAYRVTVDSLSGPVTAAHFHGAGIGENGGVVKTISEDFSGNTASGVWRGNDDEALNLELVQELLTSGLYLNVHTAANPSGEVRGQVRLNSGTGAAVQLDAGQETHEVQSDAAGTASITATNAGIKFDLTYEGLSGPLAAAHFHNGPFGENGGVVRTITDDFGSPTATGLWTGLDAEPLTPELALAFFRGDLYLNLHTPTNQAGEIRGQIQAGGAVITAVEQVSTEIPERVELHQNYPNPFNPSTQIAFALDRSSDIRLEVFNALGQVVAVLLDNEVAAGSFVATFDARDLPSGTYFVRLSTQHGESQTRTMVLLR